MKKLVVIVLFSVLSTSAFSLTCTGKLSSLVKWTTKDFAVLLEGTGRWITLPNDEESKSLALMAFAAQKDVTFYWSPSDITSCSEGWDQYRLFEGYFRVDS